MRRCAGTGRVFHPIFRGVAAALGLLAATLAACAAPTATNAAPKKGDSAAPTATNAVPKKGESAAKTPAKLDPRKRAELHQKAMERMKKKEYAKAIPTYEEILKAEPEDAMALYNLACALALTGQTTNALERLRKSVETGFVNFGHIARDTDLDSLRGESAYKDLLARKDEFIGKARGRAVSNIVEYLGRQRIAAGDYKNVYDEERRFVYLHAKSDADFAEVRKGMEEFAEALWGMLFDNKPDMPLYIVLLNALDAPKVMPPGVGGFFQREANTLFCSERPASQLLKASIVFHEFTHGLHFADQAVLQQEHPIWIVEGLSTLFESTRREDGKVTLLPSFRLSVIQNAAKDNRTVPWETFVKLEQGRFVGNANLCYAQARCMLFFFQEKGLLKPFYENYTTATNYARDTTGLEAIEAVFGRTAAEVERDWKDWAVKQQVVAVPFLGVIAEEKKPLINLPVSSTPEPGVLKVRSVAPKSPAAAVGIRKGDVIVSVEGTPIHTRDDLMEAVGHRKAGEEIDIRLEREGNPMEVTVKLGERPEMTGLPPGASRPRPVADKSAAPVTPRAGFAVSESDGKVLVRELDNDSPAAKAGIESGWRILKFDKKDINDVREFLAAVKKTKPGQSVELKVQKPDGQESAVKLAMDAVRPVSE